MVNDQDNIDLNLAVVVHDRLHFMHILIECGRVILS